MKSITNRFCITLLTLALCFQSCSEETLNEIDTNPNEPTQVGLNSLLAQSTATLVTTVAGADISLYTTVLSEQSAGTNTLVLDADQRNTDYQVFIEPWWSNTYSGILIDTKTIIEQGTEEENFIYVGIAKVYYAYVFGILTDLFGRVPESEALQGAANRFPTYDPQEAIYARLQSLLSEAITDFDRGGVNPGNADLFFGGDVEQWKKAAWGLKARYYNRLSELDATGSATDALNAADNSFQSADEGFIFNNFESSSTGQNVWNNSVYSEYVALGQTLYDVMAPNDDPRLDALFTKIEGEVVPAPNGAAMSDPAGTIYSKPSPDYLTATTPVPLLTYDELKFIEAEAHLRLSQPAEANAAYEEGVVAALQRVGIGEEAITAFTPNVFPGAGSLTLENVISQKYISFWLLQSIEAYNEVRRTGIPILNNSVEAVPRRLPYPNSELSSNNENVPRVQLTDGVWWDDGTED